MTGAGQLTDGAVPIPSGTFSWPEELGQEAGRGGKSEDPGRKMVDMSPTWLLGEESRRLKFKVREQSCGLSRGKDLRSLSLKAEDSV